jgi:hypothetical protein
LPCSLSLEVVRTSNDETLWTVCHRPGTNPRVPSTVPGTRTTPQWTWPTGGPRATAATWVKKTAKLCDRELWTASHATGTNPQVPSTVPGTRTAQQWAWLTPP